VGLSQKSNKKQATKQTKKTGGQAIASFVKLWAMQSSPHSVFTFKPRGTCSHNLF
jgi:hypothetical protein